MHLPRARVIAAALLVASPAAAQPTPELVEQPLPARFTGPQAATVAGVRIVFGAHPEAKAVDLGAVQTDPRAPPTMGGAPDNTCDAALDQALSRLALAVKAKGGNAALAVHSADIEVRRPQENFICQNVVGSTAGPRGHRVVLTAIGARLD